MFELAIGIILGVSCFLLIQRVFKSTFDIENFDYENQNQVRGGLGNSTKNPVG